MREVGYTRKASNARDQVYNRGIFDLSYILISYKL
jgi:hypothetical protein